MIEYLIKSGLCLAGVLTAYHLLFEKEAMHRFNRWFLLVGLVFSLSIPFLTINVKPGPMPFSVVAKAIPKAPYVSNKNIDILADKALTVADPTRAKSAIAIIYWVGVMFFLSRSIINAAGIWSKISRSHKVKLTGSSIVLLKKQVVPHSFMHYVFLNEQDYNEGRIDARITEHEFTHVKQLHTLDIILMELLMIVFWFNPVFWLYKKAVQLNHEFLADDAAASAGPDIKSYQQILLRLANMDSVKLANNLNYSITKKRLIMMTKQTSKTMAMLKGAALLPVMAVLTIVFCSLQYAMSPVMEHAVIANESYTGEKDVAKYELDLYKGDPDIKSAKEMIYFNTFPETTAGLSNGTYTLSGKRMVHTFFGSFITYSGDKKTEVSITDGTFDVQIKENILDVNYKLRLANGVKLTGRYTGKYESVDRSDIFVAKIER